MEKKQCYLDKSAHPPGGGAHQSLIEIALYFKIALKRFIKCNFYPSTTKTYTFNTRMEI